MLVEGDAELLLEELAEPLLVMLAEPVADGVAVTEVEGS